MSVPPNINDGWTPEPELRENPPRRFVASDIPDMNKPPVTLFIALGGAGVALGVVLLLIGLSGSRSLFVFLGIAFALAGAALLAIFPQKAKSHLSRAENLVMNGVPVMAQILTSDNLTGDSVYGRAIKYQVTLPGGDMVHRSTNAYDPALPKRIPGPATALLDMNSGDVELYCALPLRAVSKTAPIVNAGQQTAAPTPVNGENPFADLPTAPTATAGTMGTIGNIQRPAASQSQSQTQSAPAPEPEKKPETPPAAKKPGTSGLPWE